MSDIIRLLPDSVANQIAAGEVIQRPSSAVKELMENAIDSGAQEIKLIIKDAGRILIQVTDNGCGMSETDARMCFERHATSKIKEANDLFAIRTMGFRGEALASIAAIAQVELKSKRIEDELGTQILIEGSKVLEQVKVATAQGTSIIVKNLFFNVPARRNFLKSNPVETKHIYDEFYRIALAFPGISFNLYENNSLKFHLPESNLKQRISGLFGKNYHEKLLPVNLETDLVKITGFVGKPEFTRKTKGEQFFFVNKRFIKHPYLNHAVDAAFHDLLTENSYPSYFLFFDINPNRIDINIHPTKTEVNFQDSKVIYAILKSAIRQSIGMFSLAPTIDFDIEKSFEYRPMPKDHPIVQPKITVDPNFNPFQQTKPSPREKSNLQNWTKLYQETQLPISQNELNNLSPLPEVSAINPILQFKQNEQTTGPDVLQLQNRFIISSIKSGLVIIDQQRAHERILFEKFIEMIETQKSSSQQLLFPQTIQFSAADAELIGEILPDIQNLGFDIAPFGPNTFIINGIPSDLLTEDPIDMVEGILENFKQNMLTLQLDHRTNLAQSMASKLSVRPGKALTTEEMYSLIDSLFACSMPDTSPSGKQVYNILNSEEIINRFK